MITIIPRNIRRFSTVFKGKQFKETKWFEPEGTSVNFQVYNCIAQDKVPLILNESQTATWYSCGPTVYDSPHIGHASCYVKLDIIQRVLTQFIGVKLISAMGITDIDDKIIKKAVDSKVDFRSVAKEYEHEFWVDISKLGVPKPPIVLRVSEHIPHIEKFVKKLLDSGMAYTVSDGSVYFDTKKYGNYGKLQKMKESCEPKVAEKRCITDFALWKGVKPGEPFWETSWGKGRPGWHIECSAMVSKIFGSQVDFHAGGIDLQFPHHENEECQSCAYHDTKQWANYWIHIGHLHTKDDVKMSKSLKNTISVAQILEKYSAETFRMACILSNYRNSMEYSTEMMDHMSNVVNKFKFFMRECKNYVNDVSRGHSVYSSSIVEELQKVEQTVDNALRDDFDTSKCVNSLMGLAKNVTKVMHECKEFYPVPVMLTSVFIENVLYKLGLDLREDVMDSSVESPSEVTDILVEFRHAVRMNALARKDKDVLMACDVVRDKLKSFNIQINDSKTASSWVKLK